MWKLRRITKLIPGTDDHVRSAEVQLASGTILKRALCNLVPIETTTDADATTHAAATTDADATTDANAIRIRPAQRAAQGA